MDKCYIGIDLGGTNIKGSIFNEKFNVIYEQRLSTEADKGSEHVLNRIYKLVSSMIYNAGLTVEDITCMGIGVPGLLNINEGVSMFSPNFSGWKNVPVVNWFEQKLHIPVFIDNDVRVNLYGEWYLGAGKGSKNIVLLTLGTGLGSGIVMDGRVLYGATGSAGEIGHMNMYREGRPCKCGSSGCLGRYVSALGLLVTLKKKIESGHYSIICEWVHGNLSEITAKMVSEAYDLGDMIAIETLHETGEILGFGLVNVINLYNPEIIIIGGGMAAAGERLLENTRKTINSHALKIPNEKCIITTALLGDAAGMVGAAIYAKQKLDNNM
ncbi:ROK family protein [Clostridium lacusfryxellense]|uniref:ROK family protein n=1 Tax=Clostridium lacusfryxellense TaxID=205328 RepID=UPI001C0E57F7|nr:ROK family protein [Clostridium lacusfryxellense]MBU3114762.1 ROK family protein [Clostridium lacusfryxellense]